MSAVSNIRVVLAWGELQAAAHEGRPADLTSIEGLTDEERLEARELHVATLDARVQAADAELRDLRARSTAARVDVALKLLNVMRGGDLPTPEEIRAGGGLSKSELDSAQGLWIQGAELRDIGVNPDC